MRPLFKSFRSAEAVKAKEMLQSEEQLKVFYRSHNPEKYVRVLQCVAVQSVAECCSVFQCVPVCCKEHLKAFYCSHNSDKYVRVLQCVAVCCSTLQRAVEGLLPLAQP